MRVLPGIVHQMWRFLSDSKRAKKICIKFNLAFAAKDASTSIRVCIKIHAYISITIRTYIQIYIYMRWSVHVQQLGKLQNGIFHLINCTRQCSNNSGSKKSGKNADAIAVCCCCTYSDKCHKNNVKRLQNSLYCTQTDSNVQVASVKDR